MPAFSNRVTTITHFTILPKVIDNLLNDNFATYRFLGNGKKWTGETLKRPIKVTKNSQGGSFSGLDSHNTGTVDTRIMMAYDLRGYEIPVAIPGMEKAVNSVSETQVLNLVKTELESTYQDGLDDLGTMFYADGTGNLNKDFFGLDNLADDGTTADTVGNQSRTSYGVLKGTRTSFGGQLATTKLATLFSAVAGGSASSQRPTIIVSSETEFDLYDQLLSPTVKANYDTNGFPVVTRTSRGPIPSAQLKGGIGYTSLVYRGIPWVADEKAPLGTVWMLNENYLDWYGLKDPDMKAIEFSAETVDSVYADNVPSPNTGFQWTGFMRPINNYGEVAHIYLLGNFTTFQPRRQGRATSVTGI